MKTKTAIKRIPQLQVFLGLVLCWAACNRGAVEPAAESETTEQRVAASADLSDSDSDSADPYDEEPPEPAPGERIVQFFQEGRMEEISENEAISRGLTVVDLSNYWVPFLFSERTHPDEERKPNDYRTIFRKQANDWPYYSPSMKAARNIYETDRARRRRQRVAQMRQEGVSEEDIRQRLGIEDKPAGESTESPPEVDTDEEADPAHSGAGDTNHYLENYGIPPSLSVLRQRATNEVGRECYVDIDMDLIRAYQGFTTYVSNDRAKRDARRGRSFSVQMRREMKKREVTDPTMLVSHPRNTLSRKAIALAIGYEALIETQKLLECEGLFEESMLRRYQRGGLDWATHKALVAFERKNRIFGWGNFGGETLVALTRTPQERLLDGFIRAITERLVDATHIIEDGSITRKDGSPVTFRDKDGKEHPVPNLVAEYTAKMVRHLDVGTPDKVVAFLTRFSDEELDRLHVAVALPPRPPYYGDNMDLHAVIHRGDVWYDYPYTADFKRRGQGRRVMPTNTLYVNWNDQTIPLVKMNTTIGSWRTEQATDGYEYLRYKNSDVGPRVWRDIIAAPVWMPPASTPLSDLIGRVSYRNRIYTVPNYNEFGPGYASAYGLVVALHERPVENRDGSIRWLDNGIRSHGSVDYNSILRRYSHGCHRMYNHLAIRLFNFVLRHRPYERIGQLPASYARTVETADGNEFHISLRTRGYLYRLNEPVPIVVETGNIVGSRKTPITTYMPRPGVTYGKDAQFLPAEFEYLKEPKTDTEPGDTDTMVSKGTDSGASNEKPTGGTSKGTDSGASSEKQAGGTGPKPGSGAADESPPKEAGKDPPS